MVDCCTFYSSFSISFVHLFLDLVHVSMKELATQCLPGDSWSLHLSDLSLFLSIPNTLSLWWSIKELLLHTWYFLWHRSPLKKAILIRLWKTSSSESKTVQQKQRKSQGTSEAQGSTLAHLTIIKLQEPSVWAPVEQRCFWPSALALWILVSNILCHSCLPFSNKMGNCSQIVLHQ